MDQSPLSLINLYSDRLSTGNSKMQKDIAYCLKAVSYTHLSDIYHIERGYEKFIEKFAQLGATITKLDD